MLPIGSKRRFMPEKVPTTGLSEKEIMPDHGASIFPAW
jgi:hypothetical protein